MSRVLASSSTSMWSSRAGPHGVAERLDAWCFRALLILLFLAPLPLGSNRTGPLSLLVLGALVLMVGASWSLVMRGRSPGAYLAPARWPLLMLILYAVLVATQGVAGSASAWFYTADAFQTQRYLLATLAYMAAFAAVLLLVRDEARQRTLALALLASGVLQALLAIGLLSMRARYQFLYTDIVHDHRATGTFVNPNHLASYLYLCLSVGVGLLIAALGRSSLSAGPWRVRMANLLGFVMSPKMLVRLMLVVMVIALVLTRSRMGNTAFFVAVSLMGLVVAWRFRDSRKLALLLVGSLLVVDVVVIGQWVGLERVMQRLEGTTLQAEGMGQEESVEARTDAGRYSVPMVQERPWFGHGGGTYFAVFPRFKPVEMPSRQFYFDHAHNDYAELAADTGLVGLALLAAFMGLTARRALALLDPGHSGAAKAAGGAALMAVICLALHSTVDFSLQIPAVAFTFMLIAGMAWAMPLRSRSGSSGPVPS